MPLVTFDTNVFPSIVRLSSSSGFFARINQALHAGKIGGRLSETIFTLEAIKRSNRRAFFSRYRPKITFKEMETSDGGIAIDFTIGPDISAHPGNNPVLSSLLTDALRLGFLLMHGSRVAGPKNPDIDTAWLDPAPASDPIGRASLFREVVQEIENAGAGISQIAQIGARYAGPGAPWHEGLSIAPVSEDAAIISAVAEWADGDAVAAHVAYGNQFFCTKDTAQDAGPLSVFSSSNRAWLEQKYKVFFVSPEDLVKQLSL